MEQRFMRGRLFISGVGLDADTRCYRRAAGPCHPAARPDAWTFSRAYHGITAYLAVPPFHGP